MILESKIIRLHLVSQVAKKSKDLQEKFEHLQQYSIENCSEIDEKKKILYDLDNVNSVSCGLGCQLHGISAAFLCALESNLTLSIINYQRIQYEQYFNSFKSICKYENELNVSKITSKKKKF